MVVMTVIDRFSKMGHFIALPKLPSAKNTAKLALQHIFHLHGFPRDIVSDRGPQFSAQFWRDFCRLLGILTSLPSVSPPNERTDLLCSQEPSSWLDKLMWIEYAHNTLSTAATGLSPFQMFHRYLPPTFFNQELQSTIPYAALFFLTLPSRLENRPSSPAQERHKALPGGQPETLPLPESEHRENKEELLPAGHSEFKPGNTQETKWKGSKARNIGGGFKLFYHGVDGKRNGVGVILKEEYSKSVVEVKRVSDRVMIVKVEVEGMMINVISAYAPQVGCEMEEKERFWSELDEVVDGVPRKERLVIGADFNGHVGEGNRGDEEVMGRYGFKERNVEGQMVVDFAKRMEMAVVNTYFKKKEDHRVTYKSGGRCTQVDYVLCRRCNLKEIGDCKVLAGDSVARQHRMVVCRMVLEAKKKRRKVRIERRIRWWKLKEEECSVRFREEVRERLSGVKEVLDDWATTAGVMREAARKVLGVTSGNRKEDKETWWWNEEVQESIRGKRLAKQKWDRQSDEKSRQEYKEMRQQVKRDVAKAKEKAYEELYERLDTKEGEKDLYRLARQRDRAGKDVLQVRAIKDGEGNVLTSEESVLRRWREYFEQLMNKENEKERRLDDVELVKQDVDRISTEEVRAAIKRMKNGKSVGPDDIPVEAWRCLGEVAVEFLTRLFNRILEGERMPEEWRRSVLVPIFKHKGDVQSCSNYRGIKLISHTMKLWERVVEARLREEVTICEQQYGFMPRKSTTDALFALRMLMEKYREGQKELHCVFVDLEKAYDRVPREELWYWMRKSGVSEKYVSVVQDMYEDSVTAVKCAVGMTDWFKGEELEKVEEFMYLGSTVQSNGESVREVKKRVQAGWSGCQKVTGVICDSRVSARMKGKVYRSVVRPAMLYGLETVALSKRQEVELEVAELKMLRFSLGVTRMDKIRNEFIRGTAHVACFGDKVREARLRWFGHVQRRDMNYIGRRMLRMEPPEQLRVFGTDVPLVAIAGKDLVLPCYIKPSTSVVEMTVQWLKQETKHMLVHLYKDHEDRNEDQDQSYRKRTSLFKEELQKGNASLRLSDLRVSDEGEYTCFIEDESWSDGITFYVTVNVLGSHPVIMMESYDNSGGIYLLCESRGWNPEPEVLWLDREGAILPAEDTQIHRDTEAFNVKCCIIVHDNSNHNRIYCRLLQEGHMRETEIIINQAKTESGIHQEGRNRPASHCEAVPEAAGSQGGSVQCISTQPSPHEAPPVVAPGQEGSPPEGGCTVPLRSRGVPFEPWLHGSHYTDPLWRPLMGENLNNDGTVIKWTFGVTQLRMRFRFESGSSPGFFLMKSQARFPLP
ncbi:butyrophilin-like protein 3 [Silurus meridionalis]|nr:butyrophilin-like protein 3 [Silurus meridionalis]